MKLLIGMIVGIFIGTNLLPSTDASTQAPKIVGDSGYLYGLELVDKRHATVCESLYYSKEDKEIVCD